MGEIGQSRMELGRIIDELAASSEGLDVFGQEAIEAYQERHGEEPIVGGDDTIGHILDRKLETGVLKIRAGRLRLVTGTIARVPTFVS